MLWSHRRAQICVFVSPLVCLRNARRTLHPGTALGRATLIALPAACTDPRRRSMVAGDQLKQNPFLAMAAGFEQEWRGAGRRLLRARFRLHREIGTGPARARNRRQSGCPPGVCAWRTTGPSINRLGFNQMRAMPALGLFAGFSRGARKRRVVGHQCPVANRDSVDPHCRLCRRHPGPSRACRPNFLRSQHLVAQHAGSARPSGGRWPVGSAEGSRRRAQRRRPARCPFSSRFFRPGPFARGDGEHCGRGRGQGRRRAGYISNKTTGVGRKGSEERQGPKEAGWPCRAAPALPHRSTVSCSPECGALVGTKMPDHRRGRRGFGPKPGRPERIRAGADLVQFYTGLIILADRHCQARFLRGLSRHPSRSESRIRKADRADRSAADTRLGRYGPTSGWTDQAGNFREMGRRPAMAGWPASSAPGRAGKTCIAAHSP